MFNKLMGCKIMHLTGREIGLSWHTVWFFSLFVFFFWKYYLAKTETLDNLSCFTVHTW